MPLLLPAVLIALLTGCADPGPEAAFNTYLTRLERPLETAAPVLETAAVPRAPRPAKLRIPIPPGRLDALDFLALRGCDLQVTVGKRNSSLGRLAPPSQELLLELEFLRLAPACIDYLAREGNNGLAQELTAAMESKRQALPARIYNATLATQEFRSLWKTPNGLGDYPQATSSAPVAALDAINALSAGWLAGDYAANNRDVEILLSEVAMGDAGALMMALNLQQAGLTAANAMLRSRGDRGALCQGPLIPAEVDIFKNVVQKFFIGGIQPWSASLGQRSHTLLPPVRSLEAQLAAVLPTRYRDWQSRRDALLNTAAGAPRRHVEAVKRLLVGCRQPPSDSPLQTQGSEH
ncbi:MAG: DUF3080 family protein [Chromatocurvus sp.]